MTRPRSDIALSPMAHSRPKAGLASTAARNALATVAVRLSGLVVGMMLTPFLLRRIGPELYGVVVVIWSTFDYLLFEGHMETCVRTCVQTGKGQEALGGLKGALTTLLRQVLNGG